MELLFVLGGIFLLLSLAWVALVEAVYAFSIGIRIAAEEQYLSLPAAITSSFLVINLCEPLINMILLTYIGLGSERALIEQPIARSLWLTTPMIVIVFLPITGLLLGEPYYRKKSLRILILGLARWPIAFIAWVSVGTFQSSPLLLIMPSLMFLLGFKVLWSSIAIGKSELTWLKSLRETD